MKYTVCCAIFLCCLVTVYAQVSGSGVAPTQQAPMVPSGQGGGIPVGQPAPAPAFNPFRQLLTWSALSGNMDALTELYLCQRFLPPIMCLSGYW